MAVVFTDSFSGPSGSTLDGRAGTGGTWSCSGSLPGDVAGWKIDAANKAKLATANGCLARIDSGVADHYAKALIATTSTAVAAAVRAIDWQNFIGLRANGATTIELFKRISGVETSISKVTVAALATPFSVELHAAGATLFLILNGSQIGTAAGYNVSDAVFAGVTKVGLWGKSTSLDPAATAFEGGTLANAVNLAAGRALTRDRGAAVNSGVVFALGVAGGRAATRDRGAALAPTVVLAPARGRAPTRGATPTVGLMLRMAPAGGRSAGRGAGTVVTMTNNLAVAGARASTRDRGAMLRTGLSIVPTSARLAARVGFATLGFIEPGLVTGVAAELRTIPVQRG